MKKIIILAYDFPPYNSVGAKRPEGWYKHFKESGFYPIVVTRDWQNKSNSLVDYVSPTESQVSHGTTDEYGTIIRCPYKANLRDKIIIKHGFHKYTFPRKVLTFLYSIPQYFSFSFDNKSSIFFEAEKIIKNENIDLIIATGEPFILFRYASKLSKKHLIPWIADYRDGWSLNYGIKFRSRVERLITYPILSKIERRLIKTAAFITTVSEPLADALQKAFDKKVAVIRNGFDNKLVNSVFTNTHKKTEELVLAYTGTIYPYQRVDIFAEGFNSFLEKFPNSKIRIIFYGLHHHEEQVRRIKKLFNSNFNHIHITPKLPYPELLKELYKVNAFLLFANENIDGSCAKVYDYLPFNKPILLSVNDHSTLETLLRESDNGLICETRHDIVSHLTILYQNWENGIYNQPSNNHWSKYSIEHQTNIFVNTINHFLLSPEKENTSCPLCKSTWLKPTGNYSFATLLKCKNCGLSFSKQIPTTIELDDCYNNYGEGNYFSPITERRYHELLDKLEKFRKLNTILDVGCGEGLFLEIAKKRGWNVYGTEYSRKLIATCKNKNLDVFEDNRLDDIFTPQQFDVITSFEVIEHVTGIHDFLSHAKTFLRKNGAIYITTPNFRSFSRHFAGKHWNVVQFPEHLIYFTPRTITKAFERYGFNRIFLQTTGFSLTRIKQSNQKSLCTKLNQHSTDERIRNIFEKNVIFIYLKKAINFFLTLFKTGDTIKIIFVKK